MVSNEYRMYQSRRLRKSNPLCHIFHNVKWRAKKKGLEFSIQLNDLNPPDICPILEIPLYFTQGSRSDNSFSLDRVDNSKGYTAENTRIISLAANVRKGDLTTEQMHRLCDYVDGRI